MSEDTDTTPDAPQDDAAPTGDDQPMVDYDWQSPYRFTKSQLDEMDVFTKLVCRRMSQALTVMFRSDTLIETVEPSQYFGFRLVEESIEEPIYWSSIVMAGSEKRIGHVSFTKEKAGRWVSSLLGSMAMAAPGQVLSSLEQDLLYDITTSMVQTFSDVMDRACGCRIESVGEQKFGELDFQDSEEVDAFCKLTLVSPGEDGLEVSFLISSDFLGSVVGIPAPAKPDPAGNQAVRQELLAHLNNVPIVGCVRIGNGIVTMRDVMNLEEGDILLLDRRATEPIDFVVQDKRIFSGFPCVAGDRYGLQIVPDADGPTLKTNPTEQVSAE